MRSLPPPRITRLRRWKRIKRAIRSFFTQGYVSDPGAFLPQNGSRSHISIIKKSRLTSRFRKRNFTDMGLREGASAGIRTAGYMGKLATRASFPVLRPRHKSSKINLSVRF
ncbi:uncharacterized protein CANTADRAFT_309081 [Suhomyces tanzawaensis NRRL Y-17324]|uniref:Uncharacterized protein n=1 Tax=Suhomyces tanzawaensis NRRL Y-17324 TaxID=984487 RepID=A0A1E4SD93_9ASCO|nr:uncharacterized protein CANTADRAFT_309081 [Suhomyces tanzawaensis NRRL Y-17324]ODV77438.1 hypothetical protein CANTADRAFT_309081 [Suhomyces tanzawaensis NRRL Y-17324]